MPIRTSRLWDAGVSSVVGTMLMLTITIAMVPAVLTAKQALSDEMAGQAEAARAEAEAARAQRDAAEAEAELARAQREAAERAAYCARNPLVGPPDCPSEEDTTFPGYSCKKSVDGNTIVCTRKLL